MPVPPHPSPIGPRRDAGGTGVTASKRTFEASSRMGNRNATEMIPIPSCVPSSLSTHAGTENGLACDLTAWRHIC
jgi:hypothetical protein